MTRPAQKPKEAAANLNTTVMAPTMKNATEVVTKDITALREQITVNVRAAIPLMHLRNVPVTDRLDINIITFHEAERYVSGVLRDYDKALLLTGDWKGKATLHEACESLFKASGELLVILLFGENKTMAKDHDESLALPGGGLYKHHGTRR